MSFYSSPATGLTSPAPPGQPADDLATLRRIKATISSGQHPDYTAIIKPQALKQVSVSAQEAIEQNEKALAVKPRVIHRARPLPAAPTNTTAASAKPTPPGLFRHDSTTAVKAEQPEIVHALDAEPSPAVVHPTVSALKVPSDDPPSTSTSTSPAGQDAPIDLQSTLVDLVPSLFNLDALTDSAELAVPPVVFSAPNASASSPATPPLEPPPPETDQQPGVTLEFAPSTAQASTLSDLMPTPKTVDAPTQTPAAEQLPSTSFVIESGSTVKPASASASAEPSTPPLPPSDTALDAPNATATADATAEDQSTTLSTSTTDAPPSSSLEVAAPSQNGDMDVDRVLPTSEPMDPTRGIVDREQEEAERERVRQETRARERSVEKARYAEREKEKQAYRAKLREERERETQIEVQKYKEERRERERIARERHQPPARAERERGHDQYGRPDPYAPHPSLPPASWDARPAIDARFPPRTQPSLSDPHYIPPSHHRPPPPPAVYERAPVDSRPSSLIQDPRNYPPDPYYDRVDPSPRRRSPSPPPPPPPPPAQYRSYGGGGGSTRGRSPSPPRRAFDRRSVSPPRRGGYDAPPLPPPPSRHIFRADDRPAIGGYLDERGRAPPAPLYRGGAPSYAPTGYDRPRSPPPQAYRRALSPPLPRQESADELYRRMEALKEEMARLEREAEVKRLLYRAPPPPPPPSYGGRVDGYADRGAPASYRDGPVHRPYSPPPPPPPPPQHRAHPQHQQQQSQRDSYSYRNRASAQAPPPPHPARHQPPPPPPRPVPVVYAPRFDGPPPEVDHPRGYVRNNNNGGQGQGQGRRR